MQNINNQQLTTNNQQPLRILMSGGGTGGHIFPAVAIADEIKKRFPDAEFLFIGANGKMEMEKVPQSGYKIEGLDIAGFDRGNLLSNFKLPFKIFKSVSKAKSLVKNFKPDFAVGTGGFASGPALYAASSAGIPTFIQEQNAHAGVTNKLLSKKAKSIFTAYPNVDGFPNDKIKFLGNPIRQTLVDGMTDTKSAKEKLGLNPEKLTILSVGGSLGSKTLNNAWDKYWKELIEKDIQLIWQTGKSHIPAPFPPKGENMAKVHDLKEDSISHVTNLQENLVKFHNKKEDSIRDVSPSGKGDKRGLIMAQFISDMAVAYSAADIIVSRAGAIAISELAVAQKPVILVPFPFAAEDHQTANAMNLVNKNAARIVKDSEMEEKFWSTLMELCENEGLRKEMSENLKFFAKPNAAKEIVDEILNVVIG